jgi:hypothetical protein
MTASALEQVRQSRLPVILLAVCALLLHSMVTGLAAGHPSAAPFQVICSSTGGQMAPVPADPSNRHQLPDCCLNAIPLLAAPAPLAAAYIRLPSAEIVKLGPTVETWRNEDARGHSPHRPRGPPGAVLVG